MTAEYVTIPGVGRSADYTGLDVTGKIALVRRGSTTFEEKANVAQQKGAIAIIIHNNVSGEIKMNVGDITIASCSISQDDGEMLAAASTGTITIDRSQTSGPFMSDFSSWGPTPDLGIKPEITAHGGEILSAVNGQEYDRLSGTSMACPNVAGLSALLRQYVVKNFTDIATDKAEVTSTVNRLMMSTADIIINKNGAPYAVRKQGAGLANLDSSIKTAAYIMTYDEDGSAMNKTKLELGDDPNRTGVYVMKFSVKNFGSSALSYNISAYVTTEGVNDTKTNDGETTVTEEAYTLSGATVAVTALSNATQNGNISITVEAGQIADVTVTVMLSESDKAYLNSSFVYGMYVEGFIVLDNQNESDVDLNVPYLAFYGDWTQAPIFDTDYFETNADELDDSIDKEDKKLADAYATRPIGSVEEDYINYLGSYYFQQNPTAKKIAASRDYISISNQEGTVHSLQYVWAGLLRNCERVVITITEDSTGEVVFETSSEEIVKVDQDGKITAVAEGYGTVTVRVKMDGKDTYYSQSISITVKDPYIMTGPSLTHYFGNGGVVNIPSTLAITQIGQYAFSNYEYIPKDENDEISEEDPQTTKIWYIGDDTIEVIIPEGVESIGAYAFANLTALKSVTLPSTLKSIDHGAFYGCSSLTTVNGIEHVRFINQNAFANCNLKGSLSLDSAVMVADYAFAYNENLSIVTLSKNTQSVAAYAFAGNKSLSTLTIKADKLKLGQYAFSDCESLVTVSINSAVLPTGLFSGCKKLSNVTIGKDVNVIGEYAFRGTAVEKFIVSAENTAFHALSNGSYLTNAEETVLLLAAPTLTGTFTLPNDSKIISIEKGAFSGNANLRSVEMPNVKHIEDYAFADCGKLSEITFGELESIGNYAFANTRIQTLPSLVKISAIGNFAFEGTLITR